MNIIKFRGNKIFVAIALLVCSTTLSSCKGWLDVTPEDKIEKEKMFNQEEGFWYALNGVYSEMMAKEYAITDRHLRVDYLEDMIGVWKVSRTDTRGRFQRHLYKASDVDSQIAKFFLDYYNQIINVNSILVYVDKKVNVLSEEDKALIKGEALGLRAFLHFDLIRLFGPIPTSNETFRHYLPYATEPTAKPFTYLNYETYMKDLMADLVKAEQLLSKSDPIVKYDLSAIDNIGSIKELKRNELYNRQWRMNYYGVLALHARVALWMGDKKAAMEYAQKLIPLENGKVKPIKTFRLGTKADISTDDETNTNSFPSEGLFGFVYNTFNFENSWNSNLSNRFFFTPDKITRLFGDDEKDIRRYGIYVPKENPTWATPMKYRSRTDVKVPIIRLAEMYLIVAETAPLETANIYYKAFCEAREEAFAPLTEDNRQTIILSEYYKEFIGEGQIFYANKRLNVRKPIDTDGIFGEGQYVLPIPTREHNLSK